MKIKEKITEHFNHFLPDFVVYACIVYVRQVDILGL